MNPRCKLCKINIDKHNDNDWFKIVDGYGAKYFCDGICAMDYIDQNFDSVADRKTRIFSATNEQFTIGKFWKMMKE